MDNVPPRRSSRRRLSVAVWLVLTLAFTVMIVYSLVAWRTSGAPVLWLTIVGGLGCVAGIWRWFHERARTIRDGRDRR